ncbi:MAG: hypothetical protein MJY87_00380 [Fibrobacter sp.]|nr:hypothetical protein [Fibrobacter sp.]
MKFLKTLALFATAASVAALFAACGDSSSSDDSKDVKTPEYETAEDMVHCTKSHYGEFAYVKDEDAYYECTADGWVISDSSAVEEARSSSSVKDDLDDKSSSSVSAADTAAVNVEKVDSAKVVGFAQKGPFVNGSVVTVYGLDSALNTTSEKFTGKVVGDSGYFKVDGITLNSQFALVEANGFYKNAVTGKNTSGSKTRLSAIVDLSEKDVKANVNILTELEYARVVQLVTKEKYNVPAAKVKATQELWSMFGATVTEDISVSDISLANSDMAGAALYAASIALQGDLSSSKLNSRLEELSEDFAADGKWDDQEIRAAVADYLSNVDSLGGFPAIRKNVEAMKLSAKVPDYESFLYVYWTGNYGLGLCDAAKETSIVKNKNKTSANYGAGYVCVNERWHKSTALDTELGLCVAGREGEMAKDTSGKVVKYYVCESGAWRNVSDVDYELNLCKESLKNTIAKTEDGTSYVCTGSEWREASAQEIAFGVCSKVDSTKFNKLKDTYYACLGDGWTEVSAVEAELGFCSSKIPASKFFTTTAGRIYVCSATEGWISADAMTAAIGALCRADDVGDTVTVKSGDYAGNYACSKDGWSVCDGKKEGVVATDLSLACVNKVWRTATANEVKAGKVCSVSIENNVDVASGLACENTSGVYAWRSLKTGEAETGKVCTSALENKADAAGFTCVKNGTTYAWRTALTGEVATQKICGVTAKQDSLMKGSDNSVYVCTSTGWRTANAGEIATMKVCNSSRLNYVSNGYACVSSGWRTATTMESAAGSVCAGSLIDQVYGDYVCQSTGWRAATVAEATVGSLCPSGFDKPYNVVRGYACEPSGYRVATTEEQLNNAVCNSTTYTKFHSDGYYSLGEEYDIFYTSRDYVCDRTGTSSYTYKWRTLNEAEKYSGLACSDSIAGRYVYNENFTGLYVCMNRAWSNYTYGTLNMVAGASSSSILSYKTVVIGKKTWMAEDLRYKPTSGSYCTSGSDTPTGCTARLYTQAAAKTACPAGWHLPTRTDWMDMLLTRSYYKESDITSIGRSIEDFATPELFESANGGDIEKYHGWLNDVGFSATKTGRIRGTKAESTDYAYYWSSETGYYVATASSSLGVRLKYTSSTSLSVNAAAVRCVKD